MSEIETVKDHETKRIWYRSTCECMSDDHPLTIELEYDKEFLQLTMYFKCFTGDFNAPEMRTQREEYDTWKEHYHNAWNWCSRMWWRIKAACRMLFIGYIELEEAFIFRGKEHIEEFGKALIEGGEKVTWNNSELKRLRKIIKDLKAEKAAKEDGQTDVS